MYLYFTNTYGYTKYFGFDFLNHHIGIPSNGGGVLKFGLDGGCTVWALKPLPILRVGLAEKGTHF